MDQILAMENRNPLLIVEIVTNRGAPPGQVNRIMSVWYSSESEGDGGSDDDSCSVVSSASYVRAGPRYHSDGDTSDEEEAPQQAPRRADAAGGGPPRAAAGGGAAGGGPPRYAAGNGPSRGSGRVRPSRGAAAAGPARDIIDELPDYQDVEHDEAVFALEPADVIAMKRYMPWEEFGDPKLRRRRGPASGAAPRAP